MTDSADYLISKIVSMAVEADFTQQCMQWGFTIGAAFIVIGMVACILFILVRKEHWWAISALEFGTIVFSLIAGILLSFVGVIAYLDMPFVQSELDGLVTAYEALYGPLPEGIL